MSIASEYSILTDLAASLGTYHLNRDAPSALNNPRTSTSKSPSSPQPARRRSSSVQEEAELLLSFRKTTPSSADTDTDTIDATRSSHTGTGSADKVSPKTSDPSYSSAISPSFSFEARREESVADCHQTSKSASLPNCSFTLSSKTENKCFHLPMTSSSLEPKYSEYTSLFSRPKPTIAQALATSRMQTQSRATHQDNDLRLIFSLCCPSLSLHPRHLSVSLSTTTTTTTCNHHTPFVTFPVPAPINASPSYLFSRPIRTCTHLSTSKSHQDAGGKGRTCSSKDLHLDHMDTAHQIADLETIANGLATNVMQSFITAMNWRTKTWIQALSKVLSIKYRIHKAKASAPASKPGPSHSPKSPRRKRGKSKKSNVKNLSSGGDSIKDQLKKSHEARVIKSLAQASSTIVVHDVRTTFFVLEKQTQYHSPISHDEKKIDDCDAMDLLANLTIPSLSQSPPLKKKRRTNSESTIPSANTRHSAPYSVSHAITLHTHCSVSTSPLQKQTISFRTPGKIHGTFSRDLSTGEIHLKDVKITLDTDALAMGMEENARLVVRMASEECMVRPQIDYCTIYDTVQKQQARVLSSSANSAAAGSVPKSRNSSSKSDDSVATPENQEVEVQNARDPQKYYSDRNYQSYFYSPHPSSTAAVTAAHAHLKHGGCPSGETEPPLVTPNLPSIFDVQGGTDSSSGLKSLLQQVPLRSAELTLPLDENDDEEKNLVKSIRTSSFLSLRRVSATESTQERNNVPTKSTSDPFDSPIPPSKVTFTKNVNGNGKGGTPNDRRMPVPPSLVSPYSNRGSNASSSGNDTDGSLSDEQLTSSLRAPTLPALLQAAGVARARCH